MKKLNNSAENMRKAMTCLLSSFREEKHSLDLGLIDLDAKPEDHKHSILPSPITSEIYAGTHPSAKHRNLHNRNGCRTRRLNTNALYTATSPQAPKITVISSSYTQSPIKMFVLFYQAHISSPHPLLTQVNECMHVFMSIATSSHTAHPALLV